MYFINRRKSSKPHILHSIPPGKVLETCFKAFGCCCRWTGVLPIQIKEDGSAHFKICSFPVLITLLYMISLIGTSACYLPIYFRKTETLKSNLAIYLSENLFVWGQLIGAFGTLFLIPQISRDIAKFWNKLNIPIEFLVVRGYRHHYRGPYNRSRLFLGLYIFTMQAYAVICWIGFSAESRLEKQTSSILYWIHAIGLIAFFETQFFHFMHCLLFKFFVSTLRHTIDALKSYVTDLTEGTKPTEIELRQVIVIYESLISITADIGKAFGFYLLLEFVIMMTAMLMNVFKILSDFQQRDLPSAVLGCFVYFSILIGLTEGGEVLHKSGRNCLVAVREAVYNNPQMDLILLHKVGNLRPPKLTASNFFTINRKLTTGLGSTFATYVVVIIQFKLNMLALEDSK